jgi:hypothetical protein
MTLAHTTEGNGERVYRKVRRLVSEGAVENLGGGIFTVQGDSGKHFIRFSKNPDRPVIDCSCKAAGFGQECPHARAVELDLNLKRWAA